MMEWCSTNKWLTMGNWTLQFDNWLNIFKKHSIRQFTVFTITYDDGAWWGLDLEWSEPKTDEEMKIGSGRVSCFWQIEILGIGLRYSFKKSIKVIMPSKNDFKRIMRESRS